MTVPYIFASATAPLPLSQLDSNFATAITLGSTSLTLGSTVTSVAGLTLTSPTITGGTSTATQNLANVTGTLAVGNGGTGLTTLTAGYIPYGNGTSAFSSASTLSYSSTSGLTVNGITQAYNTNLYNVDGTLSSYASNNSVYLNGNAGGALQLRGDGTGSQQIVLRGGSSSYISINTASAEAMRIDSSGNVGIGTSSPSSKLEVSSATDTYLKITSTGDATGQLVLQGAGVNSAYNAITSNRSDTSAQQWKIGGVADAQTLPFFTGTSERMRIDSSGNVGIGTSSPSNRLHVKLTSGGNTAQFEGAGASDSYINITNTDVSNTHLGFNNSGSTNSVGIPTGVSYFANANGYPIAFSTYNAERMRIDSSGNLLVGTTTVTGVGGVTVAPNYALFNNSSTSLTVAYFQYNSSTVGSISRTTTATTYATSSDYRLKENIAPMQNALNVVQQLKPVTYKWKADGSDGQGFIAHELAEIVPDCVTGEKDAVDEEGKPVYQGIDTSFLVATLTAAIQEQQALIESLTTRLTALENK